MPVRSKPWRLLVGSVVCLALAGCSSATGHRATAVETPGAPGTVAVVPAAPAAAASVTIVPANAVTSVRTGQPVLVTAAYGTLTQVTATDAAGHPLAGTMRPDRSGWTSTDVLAPATTYTVTAKADGAAGKTVTQISRFTTVTPSALVYPKVIPLQGEMVGVGMVVRVVFDHPVVDKAATERLLTVTSSKPVVGSWHWFGDDEVHYRPQVYWPAYDTVSVHLDLGGRNLGGTVFGKASRTITFQTGASMITYVSNTTKHLTTYRDDKLVKTVPVSLGTTKNPSLSGTMLVMTVQHDYIMDSSTYGVPANSPDGYRTKIEWALRLTNSGQFLHSAPWSVAQQGHTNVSHGCINIDTADAGWFYANSHRGDVVVVTGTGVPIRPGDGWTDYRFSWSQWQAGSAL